MKYLTAMILLILWMLFTLILAVSIIGIIVFVFSDDDSWFKIGKNLASVFTDK
jgi:ABC-type transport system involved in multi-copper enzyme maturation permease subunit